MSLAIAPPVYSKTSLRRSLRKKSWETLIVGYNSLMEDNLPPSEDLMVSIAAGDAEAFEVLLNRHQTDILNLAYRFLGDGVQANDIAQEVFLRVWQTAKSYKPTAKFTTWLYKITANLCLNELKAARRRKWFSFAFSEEGSENSIEETFTHDSPNAEDILLTEERDRLIAQALQSLPVNQRLALVLKTYEGLPYQEIAKIIGCSVAAVESLLVRAKRTLQKELTAS